MIVEIDHPMRGRQQTLGSPIKMSVTPPVIARRAPTLGEHTREVLLEAGFHWGRDSGVGRVGQVGLQPPAILSPCRTRSNSWSIRSKRRP